jgi:predicted DNA-binding transcriptional regulator AlpA
MVEPSTQTHKARAAGTDNVEFRRMASVMRRIGLGRSTIYRLIASQDFPAPVKLAGRAVGWRWRDGVGARVADGARHGAGCGRT